MRYNVVFSFHLACGETPYQCSAERQLFNSFFFFFSLSWLVSNWKILATVRTSCIYVICHMCKSKVILKTLKKKKPVVTEYNCIKINNNNSLKFSDKLSSIFPFVFLKIDFFNFNWIGQFLFC